MLDVGQGDSILIISPDGKKLLIDTGKNDSASAELRNILGLFDNNLDYVLITHPDNDHAGGLDEVKDSYRIGIVIENATDNSDFYLGCCVLIDFVWPKSEPADKRLTTNEASLSFFLEYNDFSAFFGGDLPKEEEDYIAKTYPTDVDILKVSHHGSSTSTSEFFLSVLKPEIALISVGYNNPYNHPNQSVINMLNARGVEIYRTDESGTVTFNY
jgi:competence protein ComEC